MENNAKILIYSENAEERKALAMSLEKNGFSSVDTLSDPDRALHMMDNEGYDIVITELWMSGMDGIALIRAASELMGERRPSFILLSPINKPGILIEASEAGADICLLKPVDIGALIGHVRSLAKGRGRDNASATQGTDMEAQVTKVIHQIGVPAHIKGYQYLRFAILMTIDDSDVINSVTKVLYPTVTELMTSLSSIVMRMANRRY